MIKTGADLLKRLVPPVELMDKLEQSNMPQVIREWWQLWRDIRSDGPSVVDGVSDEVYQEALLIVEERTKVY